MLDGNPIEQVFHLHQRHLQDLEISDPKTATEYRLPGNPALYRLNFFGGQASD